MYERMMAGRSRRRSLLDTTALRAPWNTLVCSADDGTEDDDKGGGGADDPVKKLSAKVDEILGEKKKLAERLKAYEAEEATRKAEVAKTEEEAARKAGEWEKIEAGWKQKHEEAQGEGLLWKSKYMDRELNLGLTTALDEINVKPELRKAAMALLKSTADIDEEGNVTLSEKPLADAIKAWAKSDEGKAFIANGSSGGGANGSGNGSTGEKNPWAKESWNLTEQGKIYKADANRAGELARAAGAIPPG